MNISRDVMHPHTSCVESARWLRNQRCWTRCFWFRILLIPITHTWCKIAGTLFHLRLAIENFILHFHILKVGTEVLTVDPLIPSMSKCSPKYKCQFAKWCCSNWSRSALAIVKQHQILFSHLSGEKAADCWLLTIHIGLRQEFLKHVQQGT